MNPGSFKGLAVIIVTGALSFMACDQAQDAVGSGEAPTAYYNRSTTPAETGPILVINLQMPGTDVEKTGFPSFGYHQNGSAWVYVPISIGEGKSGYMYYPQGTVPGLSYKSGQIVYNGKAGKLSARLWTQAFHLSEILLPRQAIAHSRLGSNTGGSRSDGIERREAGRRQQGGDRLSRLPGAGGSAQIETDRDFNL
jgi:hypothetical protein